MNSALTGNEPGLLYPAMDDETTNNINCNNFYQGRYYWRFDEGKGVLVSSSAYDAYGMLGGGDLDSEPRWILSDAPLSAPPKPPKPDTVEIDVQDTSDGSFLAAGAIVGFVFFTIGIICGLLVARFGPEIGHLLTFLKREDRHRGESYP